MTIDMGTLAELLQGLAQGRHVDTTPFGTWGVRDMDPNRLGSMLNAASGLNQKRMESQELADVMRRQSMNQLEGKLDTNDVTAMGQGSNERIALQQALAAADRQAKEMEMGKLGNATKLQVGQERNKAEIDKANILAGTKTGKVPDMLQMQMVQFFNNPDFDPDKGQGFVNALKSLRLKEEASGIQAILDAQRQSRNEKKAKVSGPGVLGRLTQNPESAVGQAASAYTEWLKRQQAMPNPDFTTADMF